MMSPTFSPKSEASLRAYIDTHTLGDKPTLPGAIVHIVDGKNETLFSHASSTTSSIPLSSSTLFTLHSVTKVIGTIAFLQLVDRGLIALDDAEVIERLLPELAAKKILTGFSEKDDGTKEFHFEERNAPITPRMLMNHTYGGGNSWFNTLLHTYLTSPSALSPQTWQERNEVSDPYQTLLDSPLLWQPGTKTNYGQGLDWLAVLIERLTKRSLQDVLAEGVFEPLGLDETGFEGQYGGSVASEGAKFWPRSLKTGGDFVPIDPPVLKQVEKQDSYPKGSYHAHPLGTGLVSNVTDLARIMAILLPQNAGVDPITNTRILSAEAVKQISSPQLPPSIRNNSRDVPTAVPSLCHPGNLQAPHADPHGSFGLGCGVQGEQRVLQDGKKGRSRGSVYWYGAANTEFWVDGEKGVVVFVEGNYLPWNDEDWVRFVAGVEGWVYEGLEGGE